MIIQPKMRLQTLGARQVMQMIQQTIHRVGHAITLPLLRVLPRMRFQHDHLWFGLACLLMLVIIILTYSQTGTSTSPYLTYDQISAELMIPMTSSATLSSANGPCSARSCAANIALDKSPKTIKI